MDSAVDVMPVEPGAAPWQWAHSWPSVGLAALALGVVVSVVLVAVYHIDDSYNLDIGSGVFLAMAQQCREGQLYPDLRAGEQFGGTRYMPLSFLLHAGIIGSVGDYLVSGKGLALVLALVLAWQIFAAARRLGCPAVAALALASVALASGSGLLAATTIRGDLLPVVLQLGALALAERRTRRHILGAGVLAALAILAKVTAAWAGAAILLHLVTTERSKAVWFMAAWMGMLGLGLGLLHVATAGRMLDNFAALTAAGLDGPFAMARGPYRLLVFLGKGGSVTHCLFPLAILACWQAWREGQWITAHTSWCVALAILTVVYADVGAVSNHLLDLVVLSVLVLSAAWPTTETEATKVLRCVFSLVVAWCLATCWAYSLAQETRSALVHLIRGGESHFPSKPVAGLVGDGETLLSDDPWVAVSRGQRPVVVDAMSLARTVAADPRSADLLIGRIASGEFAKVVLASLPAEPGELDEVYFGLPVARAIRANYRLQKTSGGYAVFVPRGAVQGWRRGRNTESGPEMAGMSP